MTMFVPAAGALRRLVYTLRTEGGGPIREAAAIGAGAFIGCTPFYGFHLAICVAVGSLFRLNRLKLYLAANISNPFMAPFLLFAELQAGAWLRRGEWHSLTVDAMRRIDPWQFGTDLLVGSAAIGIALGSVAALATWLSARSADQSGFDLFVRGASDRYVGTSIIAWEFARAKLRADPLYRAVLTCGALPQGGTLVEVGCGQGLMLALLAEASEAWKARRWPPALPAPPVFDRLVGIETRPRAASLARRALGSLADIVQADARAFEPPSCRAVLCLDVLHLMPSEDQRALLGRYAAALETGGVILVREADAAAGWRFRTVSLGNRAKALVFGNWRQTFQFRTAAEWTALFEDLEFDVTPFDTSEGTPFGNVLFALTRRSPSALRPWTAKPQASPS